MSYAVVEKLLNERKMTAYQLSKETGVSTVTLSEWKAGKYTPKIDKIQKIANYFGIPIETLINTKSA